MLAGYSAKSNASWACSRESRLSQLSVSKWVATFLKVVDLRFCGPLTVSGSKNVPQASYAAHTANTFVANHAVPGTNEM